MDQSLALRRRLHDALRDRSWRALHLDILIRCKLSADTAIGVSRETVTRLFCDFRTTELLESRGSTLIISDRRALEAYAGIE
ncbi:MAG: helix-turn-helix domain-containing protein [Terracidiphilus sp.]